MIQNEEAYRRESDRERWDALRRMTPEESIAIGEALLTSELMTVAEFPEEPEHRSLAILLGIVPTAART